MATSPELSNTLKVTVSCIPTDKEMPSAFKEELLALYGSNVTADAVRDAYIGIIAFTFETSAAHDAVENILALCNKHAISVDATGHERTPEWKLIAIHLSVHEITPEWPSYEEMQKRSQETVTYGLNAYFGPKARTVMENFETKAGNLVCQSSSDGGVIWLDCMSENPDELIKLVEDAIAEAPELLDLEEDGDIAGMDFSFAMRVDTGNVNEEDIDDESRSLEEFKELLGK